MRLEVVRGRPPIYEEIVAKFPHAANEGVMFAWEGKVYAPGSTKVTIELDAHEAVHIAHQENDCARWWKLYLADTDFRFHAETLAHRVEYRRYCSRHLNPVKRAQALNAIARKLGSPLYGWDRPVAEMRAVILMEKR
jgi:hypothetical protein